VTRVGQAASFPLESGERWTERCEISF
jgi:hypothetical protein